MLPSPHINDQLVFQHDQFAGLLDALQDRGYHLIGPTIRDKAIVYGAITSVADLPIGYTDEQEAGTYRLKKRADQALFGYAVGPQSWKKVLHPPVIRLWQAKREGRGFQPVAEDHTSPKYAFIGVRSCELHAIAIQDQRISADCLS